MRKWKEGIRLSASDLMGFAGCTHASLLDLLHLQGEGPAPAEDSEDAKLLQSRGDMHEAAHLAGLHEQGGIIEISQDQSFEDAVIATREALSNGARIVFQGALEGGMWGGWSDFLERVDIPSDLGDFSYEVADTKLKRSPAPGHVHQLALYSDLLARIQGRMPDRAHVILGDGTRFTFQLDEVANYTRGLRTRLETFVSNPTETRGIPVKGCSLCRWRDHCAAGWDASDSLFRVAGITKTQVNKIEAAGVNTMAELASFEGEIPRLASPTLERLRTQARLQTARPERGPHHELRRADPGKGFDMMPQPDPADLFYDIEGDPHFERAGVDGLEYLHGIWAQGEFTALWAHDHRAERAALSALFDLFTQVLDGNRHAHIYHYAPYEITALKRLSMRYGLGEDKLDTWLRTGRFIDLYAVVRNGVFASEPSYSIKDMEALYSFERTGDVKTAGGSVVAYEVWRENGDQEILDEIEHYNRLDCVSTEKLRDWLQSIRPEITTKVITPDTARTEDDPRAAEVAALQARLEHANLPDGRGKLLFDLARYHPREKKPAAWAVFDAASKDSSDLCEDPECLGGLIATVAPSPVARSHQRTYRWPPQETKLRAGSSAAVALPGEPFPASVSVTSLDREARQVTIKSTNLDALAQQIDLLPSWALNTNAIEGAIMAVIDDQLGTRANTAADDLLTRAIPRLNGSAALNDLSDPDPVVATAQTVGALDGGVLPIQGPPGTGKTFVTARAIMSLVRQGKRVGVCSNSHEAIRNVLMGCIDALEDDDIGVTVEDVEIVHKEKDGMTPLEAPYNAIRRARASRDTGGADVVGGTAWLFSAADLEDTFDTIFVDEAGQVPLANALAITRAARNLVLVGDPNQLPQVVQGAHPDPAGKSCLEWVLGKNTVMPPDRGLFLPTSRRMHEDVCGYISRQFYENRLEAHPDTARQNVDAKELPESGAWRVSVPHNENAQHAPEEVDAISTIVSQLLDGKMTDRDGTIRDMRPNDIIVVAPYNVQVNALAEALPGIRCGTVDRFQGQEAQVVLVSMTASSAEETSRGLDFLLSRERMNVAISRGKALSLVFAAPRLLETNCTTVGQMRLVNTLCALPEWPDNTRTASPSKGVI